MARRNGRAVDELREIKITRDAIKHADGSCLVEFGDTRVMCTAMVEEKVPPFLRNTGTGWVTAEYGMLPASCPQRIRRDRNSGRIYEIQRLIGRSLRGVVDMDALGELTVKVDCDVLQADGGTRTASITGGFVALAQALVKVKKENVMQKVPLKDFVAAVSVGIKGGELLLDLDYDEDSSADIDMNVVMLRNGQFIEVQGTAEDKSFSKKQMDQLLDLAQKGIGELFSVQSEVLAHCGLNI